MAELLKGAAVTADLIGKLQTETRQLKAKGIIPTLAILRVGEKENDLAYEKGAMKKCAEAGVEVKNVILPEDVSEETFFAALDALNRDDAVHGILMFRPLPKHLDEERARNMLDPSKDVDGCTDGSMAGVFTNTEIGFSPCTAEAAMKILEFYGIDPMGKKAAVIGRSLVIGRPVAMMLMAKGATPAICHTKTRDVPEITRQADILIAASGQPESVGAEYVKEGQVVIDVGISWSEEKGKLVGDVRFDEAEPVVSAITPVPGGVGAVTSTVLVSHVVTAAKRAAAR